MKIALASAEFRNNSVDYNLLQIKTFMKRASDADCELICFGEAFLQGFDAFSWTFDADMPIALFPNDPVIKKMGEYSKALEIDVAFGYLEKDEESLYSSYMVIQEGEPLYNYRRITRGWKEFRKTDHHYKEGSITEVFDYRGYKTLISLCGDLWDKPEAFAKKQELTLWPVYVDFSLEDWAEYRSEYAQQTGLLPGHILLINSLCHPTAVGGCFHYLNGEICAELSPGTSGILIVELPDKH